jgi:hypothetical protein
MNRSYVRRKRVCGRAAQTAADMEAIIKQAMAERSAEIIANAMVHVLRKLLCKI